MDEAGPVICAATARAPIQWGSIDLTTGTFSPLVNLPTDLLDGLYYQCAVSPNKYSYFVNSKDGLSLATITKSSVTVSPPNLIWSEQHQPLGISFFLSNNKLSRAVSDKYLLTVAYWEVSNPPPRQLILVDTETWKYTPVYTWPLSGTDFRSLVFDDNSNSVHMVLMNLTASPSYLYLHTIDMNTNVSTFVNVTKAPGAQNYPSALVFNSNENAIWSFTVYTSAVGLTKIDPKTGITSPASNKFFTEAAWSWGAPSSAIIVQNNILVHTFSTQDSGRFIVGIGSDGAVKFNAPINISFGSIGACLS